MPKFSSFQPFGHLRFSSKRPHGETIYNDKLRNCGADENFQGPVYRGKLFCDAMLSAGIRYFLERIGAQFDPRQADQLLPVHEREYGLVPNASATMSQRREDLFRYRRLKPDARASSVGQTLFDLLGDKFANYRTQRNEETGTLAEIEQAARYNTDFDALMVPPSVPIQIGRVRRALHDKSSRRKLFEIDWLFGKPTPLSVGQRIIIDAGRWRQSEIVAIKETLGESQYRAVFRRAHVEGAIVLTGLFPLTWSPKRRHFLTLEYPWAADPETRRKINSTMRVITRGVSTWQTMDGEESVGPFTVGGGRIGITPIGEFT
jgi:hypothetical protein